MASFKAMDDDTRDTIYKRYSRVLMVGTISKRLVKGLREQTEREKSLSAVSNAQEVYRGFTSGAANSPIPVAGVDGRKLGEAGMNPGGKHPSLTFAGENPAALDKAEHAKRVVCGTSETKT